MNTGNGPRALILVLLIGIMGFACKGLADRKAEERCPNSVCETPR